MYAPIEQQADSKHRRGLLARLWQYQRERFPLLAYAPMVACFGLAGTALSAAMRAAAAPSPAIIIAASAITLLLLFQLRVIDEFKDHEEDMLYRPYRAVPRGLVTLGELKTAALTSALLQVAIGMLVAPGLLIPLAVLWAFLLLMSREFFVSGWLKKHPIAYLLSHMLIMPLLDVFITACEWLPAQAAPPSGLAFFIAASYCNGLVIELGRKIRPSADEEAGVQTYSVLWGRSKAVFVFGCTLVVTLACAIAAAMKIGEELLVAGVLVPVALLILARSGEFARANISGSGARMEGMSGAWTVVMYLTLGVAGLLS